jgi:hypothetical protein
MIDFEQKDSYTLDELKDLLTKADQSAGDRVRTEYSKRVKDLQTELAQYKPAEPSDAEKALADREKALAVKEKAFACKAAGIPEAYADYFTEKADFGKLGELFKAGAGYVPSDHKSGSSLSKEDFQNLPYSKQAELFAQNPDLVKQFI